MTRIIAIDWSGALAGASKKIWIAEARGGDLVFLEAGRSRDATTAWLIAEAAKGEPLVVGIDFAFSAPHWFLAEIGAMTAPDLWQAAIASAEEWLHACEYPFWGRPGRRCEVAPDKRYRRTEVGSSAKSVFQIGGAGAVGTGSWRGMPSLQTLREAGFCIWPFDQAIPGRSVALEIYPRGWSPGVKKSLLEERRRYLSAARYPALSSGMRTRATTSEDAFDAAVSALGMEIDSAELAALPCIDDPQLRAEGIIWRPGWRKVLSTC